MSRLSTIKEIFELYVNRRKFYMFPIIILLISLIGVTTLAQSGLVAFIYPIQMKASSPRFKSLAVTAGTTFWFFIITSSVGIFSIEALTIFLVSVLIITQIFATKLSKGLDLFAVINTKIFLGILFSIVFTIYGILFRLLRIDLLRLKKQKDSYWLNLEHTDSHRIGKQY